MQPPRTNFAATIPCIFSCLRQRDDDDDDEPFSFSPFFFSLHQKILHSMKRERERERPMHDI